MTTRSPTDRWAADPAEHFSTYLPAEDVVLPKHAAPKPTWLDRLRRLLKKVWR